MSRSLRSRCLRSLQIKSPAIVGLDPYVWPVLENRIVEMSMSKGGTRLRNEFAFTVPTCCYGETLYRVRAWYRPQTGASTEFAVHVHGGGSGRFKSLGTQAPTQVELTLASIVIRPGALEGISDLALSLALKHSNAEVRQAIILALGDTQTDEGPDP